MDISRFFFFFFFGGGGGGGGVYCNIMVYFNDLSLSKVSSAAPRDLRE